MTLSTDIHNMLSNTFTPNPKAFYALGTLTVIVHTTELRYRWQYQTLPANILILL
jgi:hypothetical protein